MGRYTITVIKLSDTDNVVVVGTDVNMLILLRNVLIIAMPSCVNLELVIFGWHHAQLG